MKKIFTILLLVVAQVNLVQADDVSVEQALLQAQQFALTQMSAHPNGLNAPLSVKPILAYTMKSKIMEKDNVYVVNLGDDKGFVIVSGESGTVAAILGYCDHGSFNYDNAPIQLKDILNGYSDGIDELRKNPSLANKLPKKANAGQGIGNIIVEPLLTTTWNQWGPYNNNCPEGCPTGCVPTAFAQIMNYWQWPKESYGRLFDPNTLDFTGEDFSGHIYDWDNMLDDYSSGYNAEQAQAVAQLMADIGKSMGTSYKPEGSGTLWITREVAYNFNYEGGEKKSSHNADDLASIMKEELDNQRPIPYVGIPNDPNKDGHALVCDGYTSNGYFHFNYGWGGFCDGYYKPSSLSRYSPIAEIFVGFKPTYAEKRVTIDDIEYGLYSNGEAYIIDYTKSKVQNAIVDIPSTITDDGNTYIVTRIGKMAFYQKGRFSKVTLGDNIRTIDRWAFINSKIDTLIISDMMEEVPDEAFPYTNIKNLTIGASIKRIGTNAFALCPLYHVTSKSPAFEVGDMAFMSSTPDCSDADWLGCITSLGAKAFYGAGFRGSNATQRPQFVNLEVIGDSAFYGAYIGKNTSTPVLRIYPKVRKISPSAFEGWSSTSSINIDAENPYFTKLNGGMEANICNKNQTSLVLGLRLDDPKKTFPESLVRLEPGCSRTKTHISVIPATVVEMEGAFKDDTSGGNVTCLCPVPPVITDATFNDKMFENPKIQLRVPEGTEELYRNAPGWRRFPNIIGNQTYTPLPDQGREYYMKLHRNGEGMESITVPISEVADIHLDDNDSKVVVRLNGKDDITSDILRVDSITWQPGFVYENAEIFELNDSTLTANAQKCTVKFDATVIDDDVQLCVRNLVLSPKPTENALHGFAVDLSLSDGTHELSGTAEITVPVQPSPEGKVCVAYYNEEEGIWEPVCFKYDEDKGTVTILTDHLSTYSFFWEIYDHTHDAQLRFYDELPQVYNFKEAVDVLLELVSSGDIDKEMVLKFKDDMSFWQSVGLDVVYNCFNSVANSFGFTFETLDDISQAMGYLGLAVSILDVARAEIEGDDVGVAAGSLNTILSYTLGQMASAIGTPIMTASMACVAFIGIALNKFGTMVQARKVELYREAYRIYYSKKGKKEFGTPYRSAKDWYNLFYPEFQKGNMTEAVLNSYLKETVSDYCDLFWRDDTGSAEMCIEKAKAMGLSSDMYPDEALMKQISDDHFAELMNGELVSVIRAIKNRVQVEANKRCSKAAGDVAAIVNVQIGLQFYDSSWKEGEISKYSGWKVRFTEIPSSVSDPIEWERTISDRGKAALGFFTLYALMENDMKCNVTLYDENGVEQKTFDFKVPEGTGKRIVNIDLEKEGMEVEYPKLKDLQLTYDPFEVRGIVTFFGSGMGVEYDFETEMETMIFLDGTLLKNTRFQKEIEKFFKLHDFITVDEFGNFKLGDDIVGKFEGDQATGTFTINTTNPFTESTVEQVVDLINSGQSLSMSYKHLLNGTLQHKIDCQFTITRNSESGEYTVNYTGSGDYTLNHEVVSRVEHMDFNNWPNGTQSITTDDIITQQKVADGTVKLQYTTKLK